MAERRRWRGEVPISREIALADRDLLQLRDERSDRVARVRARGVDIDVTSLDVFYPFASRTIRSSAHPEEGIELLRTRAAEGRRHGR